MVYKRIIGNSHPATKTQTISARPFLLEYYRFFLDGYFDEQTELITFEKPTSEKQ